jgi:hypothetical protein
MALVIASVFYNMQPNTNSFFQRGAVLFFAILMNAFGSALEVSSLNVINKVLLMGSDSYFIRTTIDRRETCTLRIISSICRGFC